MSADLFAEYMQAKVYCDRLDPATLPPGTAVYIARLRAAAEGWIATIRSTHRKLPPIHFDFIASDDVNAYAFPHKGKRFIGITVGAALGMRMLFERMLSDRRILPEIGDPRNDAEHPALVQPLLPALWQDNLKNGPTPPRDPIRLDYCDFLSEMAFTALVFHELTHIRNGHVDYMNASGSPFLMELSKQPSDRDKAIMMQAMEYDADTGAAWFASDIVYLWAKNRPSQNPHLQSYATILFGLAFATFSYYRVFADVPIAGTDLCKETHPPDRFRIGCFMETMKYCVVTRDGIPIKDLLIELARAQALTERAFHFLTGEPIPDAAKRDQFRYTEWWFPAGREHRDRLKKCWEGGLRKQLEVHSYAPPMEFY